MIKRFIAIFLTGTLCAGLLGGCGGADASAAASGAEVYKISVIVKHTDNHFNKVMAGAQAFADEHEDVQIGFLSPTSAVAFDEQMNIIETALNVEDTDAVIISPLQSVTTAALVDVMAGDKVIVALDTDFASEKKATFVGTGNEAAARSGADAAVAEAKKRGAEAPTAVILTGVQGDETHVNRENGYIAGVEAGGGTVIDMQYCDAMADRAAAAMEAIIQNHPEGVDIVFATADDMAMAAVKIIRDSVLDTYADTVVCGYDGNRAALLAVREGSLSMDVVQQGYEMGYLAAEAAYKVLTGEAVEPFIDSGSRVVDASNVEEYIARMQEMKIWDA